MAPEFVVTLVFHAGAARRGGWVADPLVLLPILVAALVYVRGMRRLSGARGRGSFRWRGLAFGAGLLAVTGALQTPIAGYAERSLTMHMVQHLLLTSVAAPVLLLGRPTQVLVLGLPSRTAHAVGRWFGPGPGHALTRAVSAPAAAWLFFVAVYLGWHLPLLYEAALEQEAVHVSEHVSFVLAALVFWWPVVQGRRRGWRSPPARILYLGAVMAVTSGLALALLLSPGVWYPSYESAEPVFGLTASQDQRLAGAVMWVFDGLIYVGVMAALFARWVDQAGDPPGTPTQPGANGSA